MLKIAPLGNLLLFVLVHTQQDFYHFKNNDSLQAHKSREIRQYMNLSIDPCFDFYEFACGNWPHYHTPPTAEAIITPALELEAKIDQDLRNQLLDRASTDDPSNVLKLKEFYKSCLNAARNGVTQQQFFSEFIKSYGGFPAVPGSNWLVYSHNYDWQQVIGQLRFHYGMNILVGLRLDVNYLYTAEDSIYVGEPSTLIPSHLCSAEGTKRVEIHDEAYAKIEREVAENLHMWLTLRMDEAKVVAADLVTFEYELCTAMKQNNSNYNNDAASFYPSYPRKTLSELTYQFNNNIDFVSAGYGVPIIKPVFLTDEGYFQQLIKTISETNKTTIANYIMYRALSTFSFPHDDHPSNRSHFCLHIAKRHFSKVVGELYYRKLANVAAKAEINFLFDKVKNAFGESLKQPWIEDTTRYIGRKKLEDIGLHFATYENLPLSNLQVNISNYWHNLAALMAQKQQQQFKRIFNTGEQLQSYDEVESYETRLKYPARNKRIESGWGLLQEPHYHQLYPNAMRYATMGQKLAQQLAIAFDDVAWNADYKQSLNLDYKTQHEYKNRSACFREQISNYLYNAPEAFKNATKLREIIAMSSGLNVAFNAYLDWLRFLNPSNDLAILFKETLPELNFTNTQLFFIAYAQAHCQASKQKKGTPTFSSLAEHTLERFDVNGPLLNFVEFARDFGCPVGTPMNPADKCVIY